MASLNTRSEALRDAVMGDRGQWRHWDGGRIAGITYPPCLRLGNLLRIPWQTGDEIIPMEPLLLYRYVCLEGRSYLELRLDDQGNPILNQQQEKVYGEGKREE